ncbi:hypothetical protein HDV06_003902 [Boothiomyces sp. JEL0866]|nr:hypothetical protein HDV06_003902 [Boothiomyces sp. JEL0866]
MRVFSGIQPTGIPHLGNYLGAVTNWVKLQQAHECFYSIVDLHAITIQQDPQQLKRNTAEMAAALIACGIEERNLFRQSKPVSWLTRMHQWQTKSQKNEKKLGLLSYPVLQAADILLYKSNLVPVGEDQLQHLNLTNDISKSFNSNYKPVFKEIKGLFSSDKSKRIMSLRNPLVKMSKSDIDSSRINITDTPDLIKKKISKSVTDSISGITYQNDRPGITNLLHILMSIQDLHTEKWNLDNPELETKVHQEFGSKSTQEFKKIVIDEIVQHLAPIQQKFNENHGKIESMIASGENRAQKVASETLAQQLESISLKQLNYILSNNTEKANEAKHKILVFVFKKLNYSVKEIPSYLLKYNTSLDMLMSDLGSYQKILSLLLQNVDQGNPIPESNTNVVDQLFEEELKSDAVVELPRVAKQKSSDSIKRIKDLDIKKIIQANEIEPEKRFIKLEEKRKSVDKELKRNSINRGFIQTKVKQEKDMVSFEKNNLQKKLETLERENKILLERNKTLEKELNQRKEFYNELTSNEVHDYKQLKKRHFILLQSQIVQLKRQLIEYRQVIDKKETGVYNVQEQLFLLIKQLQKDEKIDLVKRLEAIAKHSVRSEQEIIEREFDFHSEFINQELKSVKISDIVAQKTNHLSLFHISKLQIQLNDLYEDLALLKSNLKITNEFVEKRSQDIHNAVDKKLLAAMNNLISLGCLVPTCPLPQLPMKIQEDDILKDLNITEQLKEKLDQRISNLKNHYAQQLDLNEKKTKSLETELEFHQNFYKKFNEIVKQRISSNQKETLEYYQQVHVTLQPLMELKLEMQNLEWKEEIVFDFISRFESVFNDVVEQLAAINKS